MWLSFKKTEVAVQNGSYGLMKFLPHAVLLKVFYIPNEPTFFLINIPCVGSSMVFCLVRRLSCILRIIRMSSDNGLSSAFASHFRSLPREHIVCSVELHCSFLEAGRILN